MPMFMTSARPRHPFLLTLRPSPPPALFPTHSTSRMESTGQPGAIHASQSAYTLLRAEKWEATGGIEVKGEWQPATRVGGPQVKLRQVAANACVRVAGMVSS